MTVPDRTLRQYLAGALEPPDHEVLERELRASSVLRDRLARLAADSVPEPAARWVLPPPQVRGGLRADLAPAATMDAGSGADWWVARLDVPPERMGDRVVVLERQGSDWEVVYPGPDDPEIRAADLPLEDGRVRLDLSGSDPRRIAVVLVDRAPASGEDRWAPVREALAEGVALAVTFDVSRGLSAGSPG